MNNHSNSSKGIVTKWHWQARRARQQEACKRGSKSQRNERACQGVHVNTGKWVKYTGAWAEELGVWEEERKECKRKKRRLRVVDGLNPEKKGQKCIIHQPLGACQQGLKIHFTDCFCSKFSKLISSSMLEFYCFVLNYKMKEIVKKELAVTVHNPFQVLLLQ